MTEVLEKTATGLPELPEGYFWRVGRLEKMMHDWYEGKDIKVVAEGVGIVKQTVKVWKREQPVYGEKWYNAWKKVGTRWEETTKITDEVVEYMKFDATFTRSLDEELPVYARDAYESSHADGTEKHHYKITVDEAGISFLADRVFADWSAEEEANKKHREQQAIEKANKERLFGDYPPKTLEVGK